MGFAGSISGKVLLNKADRTEIVNNLVRHGFKNYYNFY